MILSKIITFKAFSTVVKCILPIKILSMFKFEQYCAWFYVMTSQNISWTLFYGHSIFVLPTIFEVCLVPTRW